MSLQFDWDKIEKSIKASSPGSSIYVGCDSKRKSDMISYATVIIIHLDGKHGGHIHKQIETEPAYMECIPGMRSRLMTEVYKAGDVALRIQEWVGERHFEVHVDISPNPKHGSHTAYKEAKGTILGYVGFEPVFKPNAFAASCAADYDAVRRADKIAKNKEVRKRKRAIRRGRKRNNIKID